MAIDTTNEKFALMSWLQPYNTPIPISADGLDQADKQHLLWEYPGLLWSAISSVAAVAFRVIRQGRK
jgi:hypothetical protein